MELIHLKTEYKLNPIGLGTQNPRLSWQLKSAERNVKQTAYQIQCTSSIEGLNTGVNLIWDTGKVDSDQSIHIVFKGSDLKSEQRIFWKVKAWDNKGNESEWSEVAFFETGLLNPSDWKAEWIEPGHPEEVSESVPCPYLRKEFDVEKQVISARAYITCRGLYELSINGCKVGDEVFTPGWTSYKSRLQYQVFDVTESIKTGVNAIGVILGDGWYRGFLVWQGEKNLYGDKTALLCQIRVQYSDGTEALICSNESWKSSTGPILKSDIYNGETFDARMDIFGWNLPGFSDETWHKCVVKDYDNSILVPSEGVPVRITEIIKPIKKIITPKGEMVFDLGQNIVGWVRFKLKGQAGEEIVFNHAEVLDQEGNFYTENIREAMAEDIYIFKGDEVEIYEPHFTFHGFRYIKITGYTGKITVDDIEGCVVHSDMEPTGNFECSHPYVNKLQKNIQWGLRGNFLDVPTDCPQRDERLGWTGDAQVFASTACFNMNAASFYTKWMKDFIVDQKADGSVPWVVPNVVENGGGTGWSDGFGATGWADAAVILPWTVYQSYGDVRILEEQYNSMKAWEEYMIKESGNSYIFRSGFHFGDWLSFAEYYSYNYNAPDYGYAGAHTDKELIATAYFYYTTSLMSKIASIVGNKEDAERYSSIMPKIKNAFCKDFLTQTGRLTSNTQTAYVLSLSFGLLPDEMIKIAAKRLADDVNYFGHLTTGFLGTPLICQALTENGYPEIAYKLLSNDKYPSWLYPVTKGATTIWERWDGIRPDGTFQTAGMNSFNHYAYGAVGSWLYGYVGGIKAEEDCPGYKKIIIKPYLSDLFSFARAEFKSVYGEIISEWDRRKGNVLFNIQIPANASARVFFPCMKSGEISEKDIPIEEVEGVKLIGPQNNRFIIEIGSGEYCFKLSCNT